MVTEQPSPPTRRVVGVLNLLADHPRRRLTLTEIADLLDLSAPTCLRILNELVDAAFATRDDDKTYGLGPALLRIGWSAETGLAALDLVRPHVRALHDDLGLTCILAAVNDASIILLEWIGAHPPGDNRDMVGERFPWRPPIGLVNTIWSDDETVAAWLARPPLVPIPDDRTALDALIADARRGGYVIERLGDAPATANIVLAGLAGSHLPDAVIRTIMDQLPAADWSEYLTDPAGAATLDIANITAPVYDRRGNQRYIITVLADRAGIPAEDYTDWIGALRRTATTATQALGGHDPWLRA